MTLIIKEWKWDKIKKKEQLSKTLTCPYCDVKVSTPSDTRIFDPDTGIIKFNIHKCPDCFMPIIIGTDGKVIPKTQTLPFADVRYLPPSVEKLYAECRMCYLNECYYSVIMVARTVLMHIAVDKGDNVGKSFFEYISFFEINGYIGRQNKPWVDKIRTIGNKYVHQLDDATAEDAEKVILFIKQLLGNLYEMPHLAI